MWTWWWQLNRHPYLQLDAHIGQRAAITGSDDFFLGHGEQSEARDAMRPDDRLVRETIVPVLLESLSQASNPDVITACLMALARIGKRSGEELAPALIPFLADSQQEVAETAALALGLLGTPAAIPHLSELALNTKRGQALVDATRVPLRTRSFAVYGLGLAGARSEHEDVKGFIVHTLLRVLGEDPGATQDLASACVLSLGLSAPSTLLDPSGTEVGPQSSRAALVRKLLELVGAPEVGTQVRAHAAVSAARISASSPAGPGEDELRVELLNALSIHLHPNAQAPRELQQSCALALGQLVDTDDEAPDRAARELLFKVPDRFPDQSTRNFSLIALGRIGARPGVGDEPISGRAEIAEHLIDTLVGGRNLQRPWAGLALGILFHSMRSSAQTSQSRWLITLREQAEQARTGERLSAYALGLGLATDTEAAALLMRRFKSKGDDFTRGYLAEAIGLIGLRSASPPLREVALQSRYRPGLLAQVSVGLGLLEDPDAVPLLSEMLAAADSLSAQAAIASALGQIGDRRAVQPLILLLTSDEHSAAARAFAAVALGMVADTGALPWQATLGEGVNYRAAPETLYDLSGRGVLNIL